MKLTQMLRQEKRRIHSHYSAIVTNNQANSQNIKTLITNEFTYSDFLCHLKVNRDKIALSYCRRKCKQGKIDDYR